MNENFRLFDFLQNQLDNFPKPDMINGKEEGLWKAYSTADVSSIVNNLSAGLISLGIGGNDMSVENQDKIALVSKNRPEWLMLDLACQQIGALLCPIYPTTNINELEFINGFIYANVYQQNYIIKIDPATGNIVGKINLSSLVEEATQKYPGSQQLNGIAYDSVGNKIYITGKLWPTIYEISFSH